MDLAGHGGSSSEAFGKGFNFSRATEQVMEVVNHLKIEKGHFIGLSLGSIVVRIIAKNNPHLMRDMYAMSTIRDSSTSIRWSSCRA